MDTSKEEIGSLKSDVIPLDGEELLSKFPRASKNGVQVLYKFMKFELKQVSDILVRRRLYLPRPSEFNDPWELYPRINIDLENVDECDLREKILAVFQRLRIGCFTLEHSNVLLWSHYAQQHRGLCLGFNANLAPFRNAQKVQYSQNYPTINLQGIDSYTPVNICSPVLTKSSAWSYEKEYRLVVTEEEGLEGGHSLFRKTL